MNWSWKLRRLAMLTAMSLEPSEEYVDIIESLYETTEERHDCHLVENVDNVQVIVNFSRILHVNHKEVSVF